MPYCEKARLQSMHSRRPILILICIKLQEFLQHEFSAENIHFYTECLMFKEAFPALTQSQRISMASTIFQKYLQNGATDPVNVDFQVCLQIMQILVTTIDPL